MTPEAASPQVSVILPTYNEAGNIVPMIRELNRHLAVPHEILVVDDASPDGTARIAQEAFAQDPSVRILVRHHERGLATAIREGLERSRGQKLIVMVTDFNHDPAITAQLVESSARAEMVVGSRFCPGGGMATRWRYYYSLVYSRCFVDLLLGTRVRDNLCGYYLIHRELLLRLPLDEIFYGYGDYFFRLLWHVRARGGSILETPVFYRGRLSGKSKSNLPAMLLRYTWEVLKLRFTATRRRQPAWSASSR